MIRLLQHSGLFETPTDSEKAEIPESLEKRARLVYCGKFLSMDGEVEITEEMLSGLASSHNSMLAKLKRMAGNEVWVRQTPPLQLDHSRSARDTVGRLIGGIEMGEHELEDGTKVPALFGNVRVLGKENVQKVLDGRWAELSIGADFEANKIVELTITPFPAAQDASLLASTAQYKGHNYRVIAKGKPPAVMWYGEIDGSIMTPPCATASEASQAARTHIDEFEDTRLSIRSPDELIKTYDYRGKEIKIVKESSSGRYAAYIDGRNLPGTRPSEQEAKSLAEGIVDRKLTNRLSAAIRYKGYRIAAEPTARGKFKVTINGQELPDSSFADEKEAIGAGKEFIDEHDEESDELSRFRLAGNAIDWSEPTEGETATKVQGGVTIYTAKSKKTGQWLWVAELAGSTESGRAASKDKAFRDAMDMAKAMSETDLSRLSTGQHCVIRKCNDGKWYLGLEDRSENMNWYGPFETQSGVESALRKNFANPGGWNEDTSGTRPPPSGAKRLASEEGKETRMGTVRKTASIRGYDIVVSEGAEGYFTATIDGKKWPGLDGPFSSVEEALAIIKEELQSKRLSKGEPGMDMDKLKAYVMSAMKMSAEDADKYLEGKDDEDKAKLWKDSEEHEAKMAADAADEEKKKLAAPGEEAPEKKEEEVEKKAEESEEKKAQMAAEERKGKVTKLTADFRKTAEGIRLEAKKAKITTRLGSLRSKAKITPAECKKIDVVKLAAMSDEAVDAALKTYDDREPVIPVGQFGTTKAVSLSEIGGNKEGKIAQLMEEHRANMPFTSKTLAQPKPAKRLSSDGMMPGSTTQATDDGVGALDLASEHKKVCDMMDVNPTDAKKYLKELMDRVASHMAGPAPKQDEPHEEDYTGMSALVGQVEMMQNQLEELVGLIQA